MSRHSGSARDPFESASSRTSSTPGAGLVLALLALCLGAAAVAGWLPGVADRVAGMLSSLG